MLAMILAFNAFNSPVRTMQLRQGRATSLCMEAVNILRRMDEIENDSFYRQLNSNSCLRDNVPDGAVVLPSLELQVRRVGLQSGISRPADETPRPICFPIERIFDKVLSQV